MKQLILITRPARLEQDERLLKLAGWMGVPTKRVVIEGDRIALPQVLGEFDRSECCLAVSAETLAFLRKASPSDLLPFLESHCAQLLVFHYGSSALHRDLLSWLTGDRVRELTAAVKRQEFHLPGSGRTFSRQFANLNFSTEQAEPVAAFELQDRSRGIREIMVADGCPVFLRTEQGSCEVFLLAAAKLPDINERLSPDWGTEQYYDQLIPLLIFLRHCFGASCWHGPESTARLIIDDPLLSRAYGFLNYEALLNSMRSAGYGTSIAFIPWNYWRTSKRKAAEIFDPKPNLSICVHGCDHSNREFDELDQGTLQWRAATALGRMEKHQERTGLPFERVMVFPQGRFSSTAMLALRASGYLAAVNTTCFPTNDGAEPLTIADFLRPAVTRFHGFPVFQRRYPRRLIDCAFDVFLGRPALLVQHHEYFRDGYRQLEEFVNGLHKIEPTLTWAPLEDQLMRSCILRATSGNSTEVQFFTRKFTLRNTQAARTRFLLAKYEPDASAISAVLVNGANVPFSFQQDFLQAEVQADPGRPIDVEVLDKPRPVLPATHPPGVSHTVGVTMRRALSEFRDNTLTKHPRLLAAATGLARKMKATGTSDSDKEAAS